MCDMLWDFSLFLWGLKDVLMPVKFLTIVTCFENPTAFIAVYWRGDNLLWTCSVDVFFFIIKCVVFTECSDFSPPVTVILMIFLCLEGFLFLTFTAVMFGTQIHSICNDETVKIAIFVSSNNSSRKMWLEIIWFTWRRTLILYKTWYLKWITIFSLTHKIEKLLWFMLSSRCSCIVSFSDISFIVRFSIMYVAQLLTSVWTSQPSETPEMSGEMTAFLSCFVLILHIASLLWYILFKYNHRLDIWSPWPLICSFRPWEDIWCQIIDSKHKEFEHCGYLDFSHLGLFKEYSCIKGLGVLQNEKQISKYLAFISGKLRKQNAFGESKPSFSNYNKSIFLGASLLDAIKRVKNIWWRCVVCRSSNFSISFSAHSVFQFGGLGEKVEIVQPVLYALYVL